MPELNLEALRVAAEASVTRDWELFDSNGVLEIQTKRGNPVVHWSGFDAGIGDLPAKRSHAAFIAAANPKTILQLIARLEASERDGAMLLQFLQEIWPSLYANIAESCDRKGWTAAYKAAIAIAATKEGA